MRIGFNTGVKAVRADIDTESNSAEFTPGTMTAIPVIGTDIRFRITDRFHIGAGAATQAIDAAGEMLDLKAEAAVKFSPKIGFTFGYQIMRSAIDAGPFDATLTQEGAFARIQIKF
jgi:hypothetical protein